jgi:hypothetical protein
MTNASAMTLTLLVFGALLVGAVIIILFGGGLSLRRRRPQSRQRHVDTVYHKAA